MVVSAGPFSLSLARRVAGGSKRRSHQLIQVRVSVSVLGDEDDSVSGGGQHAAPS